MQYCGHVHDILRIQEMYTKILNRIFYDKSRVVLWDPQRGAGGEPALCVWVPFFPAVPKRPRYITDIPAEPGNKDHRSYLINLSLQVEKTCQGSWLCGMLCWALPGMLMMDAYKREKRFGCGHFSNGSESPG